MKKCSSFSQNRKLVVIIVRGTFFIVEKVLSDCLIVQLTVVQMPIVQLPVQCLITKPDKGS